MLIAECKSRIDKGLMTDVLDEFDHVLGSRSVFETTEAIKMKFGMRTPSIKKSIKARTTGKAKRAVKKALIPGYGKKVQAIVNAAVYLY